MDKIAWCFMQGMELVEPDKNLSQAYLNKAFQSLKSMNELSDTAWKISAGYYTMYFALYSVLIRIGVKSEIHDCTLAVMKRLLNDYYTEDDVMLIEIAKKLRIDTQYYVKEVPEALVTSILSRVEYFLEKSRDIVLVLNPSEISGLRSTLQKIPDR